MVVANSWGMIASFVAFAVQARLLDPFVFGVFALAQIAFQITATLIASGYNDVIIQRRDLGDDLLSTIFWANLGCGCIGATFLFASASLYAVAVGVPDVSEPLRWLAMALPIEALSTVHLALSLRNFGHKVVAIRTFASTLIAGGLAIVAALVGMGIWSLIIQVWVTSFLNAALAWRAISWAPQLTFSKALFKSILPFCGAVMVTKSLWIVLTRIPEIVIANFVGAAAVGSYRMAWRLIELISNSVLVPLGSVALSTFSSLSDNQPKMNSAYLQLLNAAGIVMFPLMFGCAFLAEELIGVLFGVKWIESAPILQILALMAVPQVLNCFVGPVLSAAGSMRRLSSVAIVQVATTIIVMVLMGPLGLIAICAGYVARAFLTLPIQQIALKSSVGIKFFDCLKHILVPLSSSLIMIGILYSADLKALLPQEDMVHRIGASIALGAITYLLALVLLDRRSILSYLRLASGRIN